MSLHNTNLITVSVSSDAAYMDGVQAALRTGKYSGFKTEPHCPYSPGSHDHADWYEGLTDAINDVADGNFSAATHLMAEDSI